MNAGERFDIRPQAKKATWRSAASLLDDARREVCRAYSAFYAGADNQHDVFKAELVLYDQLKLVVKTRDDKAAV